MRTRRDSFFIGAGLLLLSAALLLTGYNVWDSYRAEKEAGKILSELESHLELRDSEAEGYRTENNEENISESSSASDSPDSVFIDGKEYIGVLEVPSLDLTLPVMRDWSYPRLRITPCRYKGSLSQDNMIIAGHNYVSHFGRLKELKEGDAIIFTDIYGTAHPYEVKYQETLEKDAIDQMEEGEWDITLFTCTLGGAQRVTVRCKKKDV
ncbi:MAG: sortase [Lachnospiraceae bacterium]